MSLFYKQNELKQFLYNSSKKYLEYLEKNNKGIQKVKVEKIVPADNNTYILIYEKTIPEFSFVTKIIINNNEYPIERFTFAAIDNKSVILIATNEGLRKILDSNCKIEFIVDFRQLVRNVMFKYYNSINDEKNSIYIPDERTPSENVKRAFADVDFSEKQKDAINNIHSSPMSYIWGGAGSGKSKYVLSYAAASYVLKNKAILVTAPTNYALENALRAIIDVLRKYDINIEHVQRFGNPSIKFSTEYPQCCENDELQKAIKYTENKIKIIDELILQNENVLKLQKNYEKLSERENIRYACIKKSIEKDDFESRIKIQYDKYQKLSEEKSALDEQLKSLKRKNDSFLTKIKGKLHFKNQISESINVIQEKIKNNVKEREEKRNALSELNKKYDEIVRSISDSTKLLNKTENEIINFVNSINAEYNFVYFDLEILKNVIKSDITKSLKQLKKIQSTYNKKLPATLQEAYEERNNLKEKLEALTAKYKKCNLGTFVYGYTLDKYVVTDLSFDKIHQKIVHVFLDEACYSPVAKTAALFYMNCPITFLGDHKQLPPVSELKEDLNEELKELFIWEQAGIYAAELFNMNPANQYNNFKNNKEIIPQILSVSMLNETYRFGKSIAAILEKYVYKTGYYSRAKNETEITVIDSPKISSNKQKRENIDEAMAIKEYINQNNIEDFAIITPYNNQCELLKKVIPEHKHNIITIHKSQGQEWDTVIISISDKESMYFTDSSKFPELLNTAVSRAKKHLIIVCDAKYWSKFQNQMIGAFVRIKNPIKISSYHKGNLK